MRISKHVLSGLLVTVVLAAFLAPAAIAEDSGTHAFTRDQDGRKAIDPSEVTLESDRAGFQLSPNEFIAEASVHDRELLLQYQPTAEALAKASTPFAPFAAYAIQAAIAQASLALASSLAASDQRPAGYASVTVESTMARTLLSFPLDDAPAFTPIPEKIEFPVKAAVECFGACDCTACVCAGGLGCCIAGCSACWIVIDILKLN